MNTKLFILATTLGALGLSVHDMGDFKNMLLLNLTTEEVDLIIQKINDFAKSNPSPSDEEIEKGFAEFVKMILNDKE